MIEKKFITQKGFLSISFDKMIALEYAFGKWQEESE
jgi:hypothetical protein